MSCGVVFCCNFPLRLSEILTSSNNLAEDKKTKIIDSDRKFNVADSRSMMVTTLLMVLNCVIIMFIIDKYVSTDASTIIIMVECLTLNGFFLAMALVRIWNMKFNMLEPVQTTWGDIPFPMSRRMFFYSVLFGFAGVVLMIAMVGTVFAGKRTHAIIITIANLFTFLFTAIFYRFHVGTYIMAVIKYQQELSLQNPYGVNRSGV